MDTETAPNTWTGAELTAIDAIGEMPITTYRADGEPRTIVPIWVVRVEAEIYVRTWHRRDTGWFGHAVQSCRARVRVRTEDADLDVVVEDVGAQQRAAVDAAYRHKYARVGDSSVGGMITDEAVATTLRLTPDR